MIWASRHYQHANPQSFLRRADCLRILLAWRAYGDLARALKILPAQGKAMFDEIERGRAHGLKEIADAYDPVIAPLDDLKQEAETLTAEAFKAWQETPDAKHLAWGKLAALMKEIDALTGGNGAKKTVKDKLKAKKAALKEVTKETKDAAKVRLRLVKAQIKMLERAIQERDDRIAEIHRRADRETVEVNEAIADLQRICADPDEARRFFVVAEKAEIEENEYNLNLPRYVDTFEPEEEIDLDIALTELNAATATAANLYTRLHELLGKS